MAGGRPEIIKGSDRTLRVTIRYTNGDPVDLTNKDEITACFKKEDGTSLEVTLTGGAVVKVGNPLLGKIDITLTDTETSLLEASQKANFKVILDEGTTRDIVRFTQQIDIFEGDC